MGYKEEAEGWLGQARNDSTMNIRVYIDHVRAAAKKGGFLLEDIGTSDEELEKLEQRGHACAARQLFSRTLNLVGLCATLCQHLRQEMELAASEIDSVGLPPEDVEALLKMFPE